MKEKTRVESFNFTDRCNIEDSSISLWLREIAGSLAVIADAMQYNKSYEQICHEAAENI